MAGVTACTCIYKHVHAGIYTCIYICIYGSVSAYIERGWQEPDVTASKCLFKSMVVVGS